MSDLWVVRMLELRLTQMGDHQGRWLVERCPLTSGDTAIHPRSAWNRILRSSHSPGPMGSAPPWRCHVVEPAPMHVALVLHVVRKAGEEVVLAVPQCVPIIPGASGTNVTSQRYLFPCIPRTGTLLTEVRGRGILRS